MKIRLIFGTALLSLSISTASAELSMRSDYRKSDVQPVKVAKVGSNSLQITYHMPAESQFFSPGFDFLSDRGVLRIAIRRCGISARCDAMAKAVIPSTELWMPKVTMPYAGEEVLVVYMDTEEIFTP
ncbi:hypothetical protein LN457_06655 [Xanthomonas phaseoli]|uniref:hypothetical protein n=1 Tax=Xanthomonas phaseoli TaxID=1985254 RepID=UPI001E5A0062|nr:hypothetical protein [Xanthomonas phaseoli]MCC8532494.1 hypothetical protein [Xanthomonas phaseoli]